MSVTFSLSNFKGFKELKSIELKPLTVVCGTNNSGKSSLIQSLLLMKQSIVENTYSQEPLIQEPLIFDGLYAHLGSYIDIVYGQSEDREIQFSWKILNEDIQKSYRSRMTINSEVIVTIRKIKTEQEIDKAIVINFLFQDFDKKFSFELTKSEDNNTYQLKFRNIYLHDLLMRWIVQGSGFYPYFTEVYSKFSNTRSYNNEVISETIFQSVEVKFNEIFPDQILIRNFAKQSQEKLRHIKKSCSTERTPKVRFSKYLLQFIDTLISALETQSSKIRPSQEEFDFSKRNFSKDQETSLWRHYLPYEATVNFLIQLWSNFRYIGPIREAPKRYYMFDDLRNIDIGINGERTPLVLIWEEEARIPDYYRCIYEGKYIKDYELRTEDKLLESVNWWLSVVMKLPHISPSAGRGVINQVKLNSWEVEVCLPDVGFGVSQILPILVECLRTRKGETIILEQPEIHLHPSLQSKLADFFICMAKSGKNLVIETHSEHLINRLCLRIAQENSPMVRDLVNILFISFDENQKSSIAQPIEINDYGEIENWPVGFFDENDSRDLIEATLKKRMSR